MELLVDTNVILDILTQDPQWYSWSQGQILKLSQDYQLAINPIIFAEVSMGHQSLKDTEASLPEPLFKRLALPYGAAFVAGQAFLKYRQAKGKKNSPLPDFYIGAHAQVENLPLLTRDKGRYASYFPKVSLICP